MLRHAARGALVGASIGLLSFAVELAVTFAATGYLFVPTLGAFGLLGLSALAALVIGAAAGALVGALLPARTRAPLRRYGWRMVGVALLAFAIPGYLTRADRKAVLPPRLPAPPSNTPDVPVLFITIDTLRADTLYGPQRDFPFAPHLGAWAKDSLVFLDAESTAGWTIPSMATLVSGVHCTTMDASAGRVPNWVPTLAEHLYASGYATQAVIDNMLLEARSGFARGFEGFTLRSSYRFAFSLWAFRILPERLLMNLRESSATFDYGAAGVTDLAVARVRAATSPRFFLMVHYMDPHAPYLAHPETPDPPGTENVDYHAVRDDLVEMSGPPPSAAQLALLRSRYEGEVRFLDGHLQRLLTAWQEAFGRRGLVVISADHGEEFLEHGRLGHGVTVHREMVHVPLLMQFPETLAAGVRQGRWIEEPTKHIDVLPTVLASVDATPLRGPHYAPIEGVSLLPSLRGEPAPPGPAMLASHSRHGRSVYRLRKGDAVVLRTGFYDGRPTTYAFYDLRSDPRELQPLDPKAEGRRAFASELEQVARATWLSFKPPTPDGATSDEESLRAIGYIQ